MKKLMRLALALLLTLGLAACGGTDAGADPPPSDVTPSAAVSPDNDFEGNGTTDKVPMDDVPTNAMRNAVTGATLFLYMTQEEVEAFLGPGTKVDMQRQNFENEQDILARQAEDRGEAYERLDYEEYAASHTLPGGDYALYSYGEGADLICIRYDFGVATQISPFELINYYDIFDSTVEASNWQLRHGLTVGASIGDIVDHWNGYSTWNDWPMINGEISIVLILYCYDAEGEFSQEEPGDGYSVTFMLDRRTDRICTYNIRGNIWHNA